MDGKLWNAIYDKIMSIDHPNPTRAVTHADRVIVLVQLRAAADDQSVSWACRPENWVGLKKPAALPSQPTMSRRARCPGVQALRKALLEWLASLNPVEERVQYVDGRALSINPFSKDREARWGYAIKGLGFGYKLHVVWGNGPLPSAWEVRSMNIAEPTVAARELIPRLSPARGTRYVIGDRAYDSNPLHAAVAQRGYQLLAPAKRAGKTLGHRCHHPARVRGLERLKTAYGQRLYRQRGVIERHFGHWAMRPEGLDELPVHVRTLRRVREFVDSKLILNASRILYSQNNFPEKSA